MSAAALRPHSVAPVVPDGDSPAESTPVRRELLERLLVSVRELGVSRDLDAVLGIVVRDVVGVLGFEAAALTVRRSDEVFETRAVDGPPGAAQLLGTEATMAAWTALLDACEPQDGLLFLPNGRDAGSDVAAWQQDPVDAPMPGTWHPGDNLLAPLRGPGGDLVGVLSVDQRVGETMPSAEQRTALELFAAQAALAISESAERDRLDRLRLQAERRWRVAFNGGLVATGVLDANGKIIDVNNATARMLGYDREQMLGHSYLDMVHPDSQADAQVSYDDFLADRIRQTVAERVLRHRDGHPVWCLLYAATISDDGEISVVIQMVDITERKIAERKLVHQATHDVLTDLPNRRAFEDALQVQIHKHRTVGVLCCHVDGFQAVADTLGREAGDELLLAVSVRLRRALPDSALLARVGDESFFVQLLDASRIADVVRHARRLLRALRSPVVVEGRTYTPRMSIGAGMGTPWHRTPADIIGEADRALRRAKLSGGGRVEVFDAARDRGATVEDLDLERDLRAALDDGRQLVPHFQTVISLISGETVGYESLLRWRHPSRGILLPDQFLPLAERTGLAAAVGWHALELSIRAAHEIDDFAESPSWLAVNLSGSQLGNGELVGVCRSLLAANTWLDPTRLHLEITESSLIDASPAVIDELYAVVDLGLALTLDDFGTGYSSLTLLRDLPVSSVKIDRSFVTPIAVDVRARTIVQHTVELVHGLGMTTIAEGIETHEQLGWLQTLGCGFGQGYLIDTPSPRGTAGPGSWVDEPESDPA